MRKNRFVIGLLIVLSFFLNGNLMGFDLNAALRGRAEAAAEKKKGESSSEESEENSEERENKHKEKVEESSKLSKGKKKFLQNFDALMPEFTYFTVKRILDYTVSHLSERNTTKPFPPKTPLYVLFCDFRL